MNEGPGALASVRAFTVTTPGTSVPLRGRKGRVAFTVSSAVSQPVSARARVVPVEPAAREWFTLEPPEERRFAVNGTEQYVVAIDVPASAEPGRYALRLRVVGLLNPDEMSVDGPQVSFDVPAVEPVRPPFPWWILLLVVGLIAAAVIAFFVVRGVLSGSHPPSSATAPPPPTLSASSLALGEQRVGRSSPALTISLRSVGPAPLDVRSVAVTGADASDFATAAGSTCSGTTLAANATCTVAVSFTPSAAGARSAQLVIFDDAATGSQTVALQGTGLTRAEVYRRDVVGDGPAVYYELSGSGGSVSDASGHGLTGTVRGGVTGVASGGLPAPSDTAMRFDGTSGEIDAGYTQNGVTAYTVEAWINTTDSGGRKTIVNDRGQNGVSLTLGLNSSGGVGRPFFAMDNSFGVIVGVFATSAVVNDGRWHQVVGTWSAPSGTRLAVSQFALYVDGQPVATGALQFGVNATNAPLSGDGPVKIARHDAFNTYLGGTLEEIAIYEKVLTPDRIHAHYQEATAP